MDQIRGGPGGGERRVGQASRVISHLPLSHQPETVHRGRHLPPRHLSQWSAQPGAQGGGGPQWEGHHSWGFERESFEVRLQTNDQEMTSECCRVLLYRHKHVHPHEKSFKLGLGLTRSMSQRSMQVIYLQLTFINLIETQPTNLKKSLSSFSFSRRRPSYTRPVVVRSVSHSDESTRLRLVSSDLSKS